MGRRQVLRRWTAPLPPLSRVAPPTLGRAVGCRLGLVKCLRWPRSHCDRPCGVCCSLPSGRALPPGAHRRQALLTHRQALLTHRQALLRRSVPPRLISNAAPGRQGLVARMPAPAVTRSSHRPAWRWRGTRADVGCFSRAWGCGGQCPPYYGGPRMRHFTVAGAEPKRCPGRYLAGASLTLCHQPPPSHDKTGKQ